MIGIIITGHGSFPNGIYDSIKLIAGEQQQVSIIAFQENQDKLEEELKAAISDLDKGDGVVCFADLAGGTPFNVSSRIAATNNSVRVIGGANSPMILSGLFQRELPLDDFVSMVINEGKENIKPFTVKQEKKEVEDDDGI